MTEHTPTRLDFESITVSFGPVTVLHDLSLSIAPGEIVGLLGHNGAGKSTLINVATGALRSYEGSLSLDGEPLPAGSGPGEIAERGIAVIHQEPALAPNLTVLDNLFLARRDAVAPRGRRVELATGVLDALDASDIRLDHLVETLSLGKRQMVDLARAMLVGEVKVLFLDEPTAALGEHETRVLHDVIRRLAAQGTAIVYVSHRLPDIIDVCGRIVALREGRLTLDAPADQFTPQSISQALAGENVDLARGELASPAGDVVLASPEGRYEFRSGEIVGLYGMAGGEQFEILQHLYGLGDDIRWSLGGEETRVSGPPDALAKSIHLVPGDREYDGLIGGMSAIDNVFLPWLHKREYQSSAARRGLYAEIRERLAIQGPDLDAPISTFSGGNRQKHLLARWIFPHRPRVLLLEQPTQGVDVAAKADIRRCLRELAATGTAIVIASAETDEIASLCNRSYVVSGDRSAEVSQPAGSASGAAFEAELLSTLFEISQA